MFHRRVKRLSSESLTLQVIGTCVWAGVDNAWEQEKLEARKMLINAADFPSVQCTHEDGERSFYTRETRVH